MSSTADSTLTDSPGPADGRSGVDQRHRKAASSTGGGRAWSSQEEAYLIETRMHKMPYKHIAAHLKKTELACRLHYHQLSFGNKRHRRAASTSSFASVEHSPSSPSRKTGDDFQQRQLPPFNLAATSDRYFSPSERISTSPQSHIPILPKPIPYSQRTSQSTKALRLITEDMGKFDDKPVIDIPRLNRIYNAHRIHFWSMIAQSYGGTVCPSTLEDAWCRHQTPSSKADFPPTPCGSPESTKVTPSIPSAPFTSATEYSKGFTPINTPPTATIERSGSFAISSLLTEDKEVRSPAHERR